MKYLNATCYPEFISVSLHFEKKQWPQTWKCFSAMVHLTYYKLNISGSVCRI